MTNYDKLVRCLMKAPLTKIKTILAKADTQTLQRISQDYYPELTERVAELQRRR